MADSGSEDFDETRAKSLSYSLKNPSKLRLSQSMRSDGGDSIDSRSVGQRSQAFEDAMEDEEFSNAPSEVDDQHTKFDFLNNPPSEAKNLPANQGTIQSNRIKDSGDQEWSFSNDITNSDSKLYGGGSPFPDLNNNDSMFQDSSRDGSQRFDFRVSNTSDHKSRYKSNTGYKNGKSSMDEDSNDGVHDYNDDWDDGEDGHAAALPTQRQLYSNDSKMQMDLSKEVSNREFTTFDSSDRFASINSLGDTDDSDVYGLRERGSLAETDWNFNRTLDSEGDMLAKKFLPKSDVAIKHRADEYERSALNFSSPSVQKEKLSINSDASPTALSPFTGLNRVSEDTEDVNSLALSDSAAHEELSISSKGSK